MHIELIDLLRCPRDHEETWLVAAFTKLRDRYVEEARLGCPVCSAAYVIHGGVAEFGLSSTPDATAEDPAAEEEAALRLAAFLHLANPGSLAVLQGTHAALCGQVSNTTQCRVIALDPHAKIDDTELVAAIRSDSRIPLASGSVDGAALSDSRYVNDAPRVLRQGGRLVVPADVPLPAGIAQLARDDFFAIGEAHGPVISLRRS